MSQPSPRSTSIATKGAARLAVGLTLVIALGACGTHGKVDVPDGSGVADANPVKKKAKTSDATAKNGGSANDSGSDDATTTSGGDSASGSNGVADATADNATPVSSTSTDPSATAAPTTTASNGNDTTTTATPAPTTAPTTTAPAADPVKTYLVCWMGRVMQRASSETEIASYYAAVQAGEERRQQVAKMFGSDAYFARWSTAAKPWQAFANHAYLDIMGVSAPTAWTSSTLSTLAKEANASGRTKVARTLLDKKWPVASGVPPCS